MTKSVYDVGPLSNLIRGSCGPFGKPMQKYPALAPIKAKFPGAYCAKSRSGHSKVDYRS